MEQKNACHLSLLMSSSHSLLMLKSSKGAAARERREELEEDKPQVGSNSSLCHPNLTFICNGLGVVSILSGVFPPTEFKYISLHQKKGTKISTICS